MRKVLEYELSYYDEAGDEKTGLITVAFVSNRLQKELSELYKIKNQVVLDAGEMSSIRNQISDLMQNGYAENTEKIDKLLAKLDILKNQIMDFDSVNFDRKRSELIIKILSLKMNHVSDERFLDPDFWEDSTDPETVNDVWERIFLKDQDDMSKKKAVLK